MLRTLLFWVAALHCSYAVWPPSSSSSGSGSGSGAVIDLGYAKFIVCSSSYCLCMQIVMMRKCSCGLFTQHCHQHYSVFSWKYVDVFCEPFYVCCGLSTEVSGVLLLMKMKLNFFSSMREVIHPADSNAPLFGLLSSQLIVAQNVAWCQSLSSLPENDYKAMRNGAMGNKPQGYVRTYLLW